MEHSLLKQNEPFNFSALVPILLLVLATLYTLNMLGPNTTTGFSVYADRACEALWDKERNRSIKTAKYLYEVNLIAAPVAATATYATVFIATRSHVTAAAAAAAVLAAYKTAAKTAFSKTMNQIETANANVKTICDALDEVNQYQASIDAAENDRYSSRRGNPSAHLLDEFGSRTPRRGIVTATPHY